MIKPCLMIVIALVVCGSTVSYSQQDSLARFISRQISVSGKVSTPLQISLTDLGSYKQHTITNVAVISYSGEKKEPIRSAKGVLLRDILNKADIVFDEKRDFNRTLIRASATDGFQALFTWHEIFNSEAGNHIFILTEKDGKPLPPKEADFMLISTTDLKTGPRHVRWLKSIEVLKL